MRSADQPAARCPRRRESLCPEVARVETAYASNKLDRCTLKEITMWHCIQVTPHN